MSAYIQLLLRLCTLFLLLFALYRVFIKSDKPAALALMLGLMIIAEDYMEKSLYIPGLKAGSVRFSEILIVYLLFKSRVEKYYEKFSSGEIDRLWFFFASFFLIAILTSSFQFVAVRNFRFILLDVFLIYVIGCQGFKDESDYLWFVVWLAILIMILALGSIVDLKFKHLWLSSPSREMFEYWGKESIGRYGSFFLNPNFLACFLLLTFPSLLLSLFANLKKYLRLIIFFSFFAGVLALILTYTRASYFAVAATIVFAFYLRIGRYVAIKRLVGCALLFIFALLIVFPGAFNKIRGRADTIEEESEYSRLIIWKNSLQILKKHPLIGVGLSEEDYKKAAVSLSGNERLSGKFGSIVEGFMDQPHNSYISLATWVSPVALVIFIYLNFKIIRIGKFVLVSPNASDFFKLISLGLILGQFSFIVIIVFDTQLFVRATASLYWLFVGLLVSIYRRVKTAELNAVTEEETSCGRIFSHSVNGTVNRCPPIGKGF